ncbi:MULTISPECIES: LCP family protein [unclassified Bacillus (in: firmicutes)]|jgi:polyisoprenyl-teichoic acid--peptidoglycan teichoic acid transferase|uniref:Regulatory protein MsrR n=1 Tax=Priestia megaterium TaxID=1404 RepID=A0A6H1P0F2_PRIMG|nr:MULTISPECIES: LCP family protein [Bacillaceae]MBT2697066.1 LCP family protein [Bacillus sp. ISL-40]MBT2721770.1 LCP family protein [Bacillus sp. ISL-46]MBT2735102.1 LCP family protein [Bacillus sp. ISL-7]MBT2740393.1 LCP family protein [Bacillus sp. ISL-77]QIZ07060.1 LCP family protein [Priestia megaterium]
MRSDKYQTKKKRRWPSVLLVFLLLIGAGAGYAYYQYKQGVNQSLKKMNNKASNVVYAFEGKKDQYGGTNILVLGSDARGKEKSRADTIMIVHYNEDKGTFKLTSIMRDSYLEIPGHGQHKVNSAFARGGPELMRQTIKQNFDIDLQYYVIVDFQGFVQLIDEAFPNGVEIDVEKKMSKNIDVTLEPGLQKLNGAEMLGYVRYRHDAIGDFGRVERQQKAVKAIGDQLMGLQTIPKLPKLIGVVTPYVNTNMSTSDITFMAKDFFSNDRGNIDTLRIPVENSYSDARISGEGAVLEIDVEKNKEALHQFITK